MLLDVSRELHLEAKSLAAKYAYPLPLLGVHEPHVGEQVVPAAADLAALTSTA